MTRNFDSKTEQLMDMYLRRELSPEQTLKFERRIKNEPQLVEEMLLRKDIIEGIKAAERDAIRKMLDGHSESNVALYRNAGRAGRLKVQALKLLLIGGTTIGGLIALLHILEVL